MFTGFYCCFMPEDFVVCSYICGRFMESIPFLNFLGYHLLRSFPVRGSFAIQFGDHFRSRDHIQAGIILVSFAAVIRVVTQRSSLLTAAHERDTFLSLKLTSKKQASIFWKPGPSPSPLLESKHSGSIFFFFKSA